MASKLRVIIEVEGNDMKIIAPLETQTPEVLSMLQQAFLRVQDYYKSQKLIVPKNIINRKLING